MNVQYQENMKSSLKLVSKPMILCITWPRVSHIFSCNLICFDRCILYCCWRKAFYCWFVGHVWLLGLEMLGLTLSGFNTIRVHICEHSIEIFLVCVTLSSFSYPAWPSRIFSFTDTTSAFLAFLLLILLNPLRIPFWKERVMGGDIWYLAPWENALFPLILRL